MIGFVYGYRGLYHNNYVELTEESVEDIYKEGGTILYSSNKDNLFDYLVDDGKGGKVKKDLKRIGKRSQPCESHRDCHEPVPRISHREYVI